MNEYSPLYRSELQALLGPVLDEAIKLTGFQKGNIQLLDRADGTLSIVCQRGFDETFLEVFARVSADTGCACGRALKERQLIFIGDVLADADYAPYREAAREAGYRSVLSLPVMTPAREVLGMMSVHHQAPVPAPPADISHLGEFAAGLIVRQSLLD